MKKKWFYSAVVVGLTTALTIPLMGFSSSAASSSYSNREDVALQSGGLGVPIGQGPFISELYHEPSDGIISGAIGCQPDQHVFKKNNIGMGPNGPEAEHIVFTAGVEKISTFEEAKKFDSKGYKVFVEITSDGTKVAEQEFYLHPTVDPNTKKPFWVSAVYLNGEVPGGSSSARTAKDLPTGEYTYKFVAKDKQGHVRDVWAPKNNKITITD